MHIPGQYTRLLTLKYMACSDYRGLNNNITYVSSNELQSIKWTYGPNRDRISTHCHITTNNIHYQSCIDYAGLDMYREWKKTEFPKEYCI
jgi:hypothetical protein